MENIEENDEKEICPACGEPTLQPNVKCGPCMMCGWNPCLSG